jgi:hypothetical protein
LYHPSIQSSVHPSIHPIIRPFILHQSIQVLHMLQQQQKEVYFNDKRVVWVRTPDIPIATFRLDRVLQARLLHARVCVW